jgi:hypothetical protein
MSLISRRSSTKNIIACSLPAYRIVLFVVLAMHACVPKATYEQLNYELSQNQGRLDACRLKEHELDADIRAEEQIRAQKTVVKRNIDDGEIYVDLRDRLKACDNKQFKSCIDDWRLNQDAVIAQSVEIWKRKVSQKESHRDSLNAILDSLKFKWYYIDTACRVNSSESATGAAEQMISAEKQLPLKEKIIRAFLQDSFYLKSEFELLQRKNDTVKSRFDDCSLALIKKRDFLEELLQPSKFERPLNNTNYTVDIKQVKREIEQILGDPNSPRNNVLYANYRMAENHVNSSNDPKRKLLIDLKQRHQNLEIVIKNRQVEHNKWALFVSSLERDCPSASRSYAALIEAKYRPIDSLALPDLSIDQKIWSFIKESALKAKESAQKTIQSKQDSDKIGQPETRTASRKPNSGFSGRTIPVITPDDSDGDGIPDADDDCKYTPAHLLPVDARGCSIINFDQDECSVEEDEDDELKGPIHCGCRPCMDDDEDGVFNFEDSCQSQKGSRQNKGCPLVLASSPLDSISFSVRSFEAGMEDLELLRVNLMTYRSKNNNAQFKVIGLGDYSDGNLMYFAEQRTKTIVSKLKEWGVPSAAIWSEPQEHNPSFKLSRAVYIYVD